MVDELLTAANIGAGAADAEDVPPRFRVLVVDDSASYRRLLTVMLKRRGYDVCEAADGVEAFDLLRGDSDVRMVISDWDMPLTDGPQLCRAVRNHDFGRYIYLILVTSRDTRADLVIGMEAGADDFLTKPVDPTELLVRMRAGQRILELESSLEERNRRLNAAYDLIKDDLHAAAKVQRSLLPDRESMIIEGVRADWLFIPSVFVSGDTLDVFSLDENTVAFYNIDVAGHGVPSAMLSVTLSRLLSQGRADGGLLMKQKRPDGGFMPTPPHLVAEALNEQFQMGVNDTMYFTLVYGIIDIHRGEGLLTRAGHTTPVIVAKGGRERIVGEGGLPIGMLPDGQFVSEPFSIAVGDRLYLYSDGITECFNSDGAMYGDERLLSFFRSADSLPVDQVTSRLEESLREWRGPDSGNFDDDVSLLVIERLRHAGWSPRPVAGTVAIERRKTKRGT